MRGYKSNFVSRSFFNQFNRKSLAVGVFLLFPVLKALKAFKSVRGIFENLWITIENTQKSNAMSP